MTSYTQPTAENAVQTAESKSQEAKDIEKNAEETALQRQVSGPPYSIFTPGQKMWIVFLVSVSALISPFGATTFYPVLNVLSDVLHVTPTMTNISITTYMIAQAIAPALIGGMSDNSGRRLSFIVCFVIFIVANIGLALQTNYIALLMLRILQACGCSAAISLSVAVVADIATSAERGKYMGYATCGILFGPAFGPTIGGVLAQYLGWRSIFWFLAIFAGVLLFLFAFLFPETCRAVVGNGSVPARGVNRSILGYLQERKQHTVITPECEQEVLEKRKFELPNPLKTLRILGEKESCIILLYNGLFFTGMMVVSSAIPDLFKEAYGLDELKIGLCYISLGTGCLVSSLTTGHIVDWNFRRHAKLNNITITQGKQQDLRNFPIEKVRLQVVAPGHVIGTAGLVFFGWVVRYQVHIAATEVALFIIGFGVSTAFNITNTLLIDLHRDQPATATAAVNFVRCLMSAGGAAAIIPMCKAMNPGWAFTFIALVYAVLIVVVFWVMRCGMGWRREAEKKKRGQEG
ncbi:MFS general substrate transporter [Byssothecium circinans]|uniref:MFS general substrate transporter n=1 Tax=Byssothecium circinans TaxID=147558 RepID=A0A6A5T959_9PLEO|nr:MFS general substrate transporter [Byssothecium circinans]